MIDFCPDVQSPDVEVACPDITLHLIEPVGSYAPDVLPYTGLGDTLLLIAVIGLVLVLVGSLLVIAFGKRS